MNEYIGEKIKDVLETAKIHQKRLEAAYNIILTWGKLDTASFNALSDEKAALTDQYIYRFAKLQDLMGDKLFKLILEFIGENTERMAFIDILNKLEKLTVLESVETWLDLRIERNKIAHDYAKHKEELIQEFEILLIKKSVLVHQLGKCIEYLKSKGLRYND